MFDHFDQSCNPITLSAVMRRGDFHKILKHERDKFREDNAAAANTIALNNFSGPNPIKRFHLKKKPSYGLVSLPADLVVRKISKNLKRQIKRKTLGRAILVKNLYHFLGEESPYRVYRLDIKSFYESFTLLDVKAKVDSLTKLAPESKKLLHLILANYTSIGGVGLPRGMAISAVLSDFIMSDFDDWVRNNPSVYFYGRYVDDILIVTNLTECRQDFIKELECKLPQGLRLNTKKCAFPEAAKKTQVQKKTKNQSVEIEAVPKHVFSFDYLGYQFSVLEPTTAFTSQSGGCFRQVRVEIAPAKVEKIKSRIVRSFLDFFRTSDQALLINRIKYLTSNFYVINKKNGCRQLSGIYYGYPMLSNEAKTLAELDAFLRNAVLSKRGRVFSKTSPLIDSKLRRSLLSYSFATGHKSKRFVYFSLKEIGAIQQCWKHE